MTQPTETLAIRSCAITDRGLNERRPLNEDSFLADNQRGVFAVADGVGGAEAGEVASQTAVEVLEEAFRHQLDGADIEDLMELAIQRANASIHQMAQEHARFSMMATTIVALHLNGKIATIGHVGDSRLYRLTPEGELVRETEDHSVVEEEVRAGRMTPEQAANHPSKNVISRALGAENDVDVDMKTVEIDEGTQFLLCTDGITRHIPDYELRQLLILNDDLSSVCEELKRRCYERGAEDNLTAVLVRVGEPIPAHARAEELEPTISPETEPVRKVIDTSADSAAGTNGQDTLIPPSRIAFPATDNAEAQMAVERPLNIPAETRRASGGSAGRILLFVAVIAALAGAFYAGRRYKGAVPFLLPAEATATPQPTPVFQPAEDPILDFARAQRQVDTDPAGWLVNARDAELVRQSIQTPLESNDAEFLYLFGRASLLTGDNESAARAFEATLAKSEGLTTPEATTLRKEAVIGLAAVALRADKERANALTHLDQMLQKPTSTNSP